MIPIYQLPEAAGLTERQISEAIAWKEWQNEAIRTADKYYKGLNREILASKHGHRIPVPYGRKLIKSVLGFMFKEGLITYSWPDDWEDFRLEIESIFDYNDEQTENIRLARDQAMYGSAYEALFVDNPDARPQFYRMPAHQVIPVRSYGIRPRMWAAVNCWRMQDERMVEVYYADRIERYSSDGGELMLRSSVPHRFGEVPIVEYRNNEEGMGDIESIMSLIDAHDEIIANGLDEDGKFADAILALKNIQMDDETVEKLIRMRVLSMDDDGEASYLTKPDRYAGREALRKVIEGLIFSMSGIPNLDDKDAMSTQSGESLKYLYATFEIMVAGDKQSGFTDGLMRRLRLINNFLSWLGRSRVSMDGVQIKWQRNLPAEGTTLIDNVIKATGIISRRTQLEQLQKAGLVDSVDREIDRLDGEKEAVEADLTDEGRVMDGYGV